jgi:hypothetical protein
MFSNHPVLRRRFGTLVSYRICFVINGSLNVFLCRNCLICVTNLKMTPNVVLDVIFSLNLILRAE